MAEEEAKESDKKEEDFRKQVSEMYTPLSVAKEEIWRRWNDKELRKKVEDFLGGDLPEVFKNKPSTAIFRYVATPNLEFQLVFDLSKTIGLDLIFIEFLKDKFCTVNNDKLYLGKMRFYNRKNGEKNCIVGCRKVIDIKKYDGKKFEKIETISGENFVDFHHRIFLESYKNIKTLDASQFKLNEETAYEVYLKIFPLFICNGILFENYFVNTSENERRFVAKVIRPAFNKVQERFGLKPLIVPLINSEEENDIFWQYYDEKVMAVI